MGWTIEGSEFDPGRIENLKSSISSRSALGSTILPVEWVSRALSFGVKQQGREAVHSPPTSAEVNKTWIYTYTPSYAFMVYDSLLQHRDILPYTIAHY
jgi:hypothetical protein